MPQLIMSLLYCHLGILVHRCTCNPVSSLNVYHVDHAFGCITHNIEDNFLCSFHQGKLVAVASFEELSTFHCIGEAEQVASTFCWHNSNIFHDHLIEFASALITHLAKDVKDIHSLLHIPIAHDHLVFLRCLVYVCLTM